MLRRFLKVLGIIVVLLALVVVIYFVFMTVTDYKPKEVVSLNVENNLDNILPKETKLSALTFNIGYCGLDAGQDFFMDGGTGSRSKSKEKTLENLKGITEFIEGQTVDFILLQEVDIKATRSYNINEYEQLKEKLTDYSSTYCINYKVPWVPVPLAKPHGSVKSGLVTLGKYKIDETNRYGYPGKEKWPRQLALLDRCFIESRLPVEDGKELVLLNSHLSAYDKGGVIRKQQLGFLKEYISKEYEKGNYVVVAGDWNHAIPGTDSNIFESSQEWPEWLKEIPEDFKPEGFKWGADKNVPTNRTVDIPYKKGENYLSVIDGFLVSPNVDIVGVKGHQLDFEYTDHNPVTLEFILK
ncbi:endonuclease/exonuclease/phosphatase family protein [Vallitalea guaymasensis]|uniref:endonuclease/exonuclease/phosphatase family protein n=2 Tax=Vallitalea guaymasensis TaxID=1185412 RepID=UPI001FA8BE4A|nr:endonuclease/exonuclease/phosphatase family protein [Vallitalea guaymasensis]